MPLLLSHYSSHTQPAPGIRSPGPGSRLIISGAAQPEVAWVSFGQTHSELGLVASGGRVTELLKVLEAPGADGGNPHWKIHAEAEVAASTCHRPWGSGGPRFSWAAAESTTEERGGDQRPEATPPAAVRATRVPTGGAGQGPVLSEATGRHRPRRGDLVI